MFVDLSICVVLRSLLKTGGAWAWRHMRMLQSMFVQITERGKWQGSEVEETAGSVCHTISRTRGRRQCGDVRAFYVPVDGSCQCNAGLNMSDSLQVTSTSSVSPFVSRCYGIKFKYLKYSICCPYSTRELMILLDYNVLLELQIKL